MGIQHIGENQRKRSTGFEKTKKKVPRHNLLLMCQYFTYVPQVDTIRNIAHYTSDPENSGEKNRCK